MKISQVLEVIAGFKVILEESRDKANIRVSSREENSCTYVGVHVTEGACTVPRSIVAYRNACYVLADGANRHECKYVQRKLETNRGEFTNHATRVVPEVNFLHAHVHFINFIKNSKKKTRRIEELPANYSL